MDRKEQFGGRGMRSLLRMPFCFCIAAMIHGSILLIPWRGLDDSGGKTLRGIRIHSVAENPSPGRGTPLGSDPIRTAESPPRVAQTTPTPRDSSAYGEAAVTDAAGLGGEGTGGMGSKEAFDRGGVIYGRETGDPAGGGEPYPYQPNPYREYLSRLRSKDVQTWAKESAGKSLREWKEIQNKQSGQSPFFAKKQPTGLPSVGSNYLDPRVRMVVNSYPSTGIERRYTHVSYPDLQIKKHQYTSGWWNVYIEIRTNETGKIARLDVLRPETDGPLEKLFVQQVRKEIEQWRFDPVVAEVHVDVRFYVE